MSKQNLTKNNFAPFMENIFNGNTLDFPELIKKTPFIPSIYFNQDLEKNEIIDIYFKINLLFDELENIKSKIFFILNTSKTDLEKMKFSMTAYNLSMDNLLINITQNPKNDFKKNFEKQENFKNFIDKFTDNDNFKIFKDNESIQKSLNFFYIFQNTFTGNSNTKKYFLSLFKLYISTRTKLVDLLKANYGILAFYLFFDIKENNAKKSKDNSTNSNNNSEKINYSKYKLLNDAVNNEYEDNAGSENENSKKNKYTLDSKVNKYNKLYVLNFYDNNSYKLRHKTNMNNLFKNFHESLMFFVGNKSKNNLYNVCYYDIETDFYLLKFLYSYVSVDLFNKCIDLNFKIKSKIYKSINIFDVYYEQYINWWKQLSGKQIGNSNSKSIGMNVNFDTFLNQQMKKIFSI